jgi:hypothetical protein
MAGRGIRSHLAETQENSGAETKATGQTRAEVNPAQGSLDGFRTSAVTPANAVSVSSSNASAGSAETSTRSTTYSGAVGFISSFT